MNGREGPSQRLQEIADGGCRGTAAVAYAPGGFRAFTADLLDVRLVNPRV
jgi:hypothetical protein